MDEELKGIQEIRLRKSGAICISVAASVRMCASQRGVSEVIFDDFPSNDLWIIAEAFKTAAVRVFEEECGKVRHAEILYAK